MLTHLLETVAAVALGWTLAYFMGPAVLLVVALCVAAKFVTLVEAAFTRS